MGRDDQEGREARREADGAQGLRTARAAACIVLLLLTAAAPAPAGETEKDSPPFGTVTPTERIPGDLDCKGDCKVLRQGGYMRFDLSGRPPDAKVETASLRVLVKRRVRNPWLWVCQITQDPLRTPPKKLHAEIQQHAILLSGAMKAEPEGWMTIRLNARAVERINRAIASKQDRWFAVALTFE